MLDIRETHQWQISCRAIYVWCSSYPEESATRYCVSTIGL